jgi:hypothetical protein
MLRYIVISIFSFLIGVLLVRSCHKTHDKPLNNVIQFIDKEIIKTDTLIKTKTVVRNKEVEKLVPYQHLIYVPSYILCQDTNRVDSLKTVVVKQFDIIKRDDSLFVLYRHNDSLHIKKDSVQKKYTDSLLTAPNKYWKGFLHGAGAGFATGLFAGKTL